MSTTFIITQGIIFALNIQLWGPRPAVLGLTVGCLVYVLLISYHNHLKES